MFFLVVTSFIFFFFSSRRRHTRSLCDWSSDVCSSDLHELGHLVGKLDAAPGHPIGAQLLGHDHILARPRSLGLEERTSEPGLPNDREESPHPKLGVTGDGTVLVDSPSCHCMTTWLPRRHLDKAVFGEDATDVTSREGSEPTQPSRR